MSQNLTQPEEIDLILMAVGNYDLEAGMSIADGEHLTATSIRQGEPHEAARTPSHCQVAQH